MSKRLNQTDHLELGDQLVVYKGNCTDFRALPYEVLVDLILDKIVISAPNQTPTVQYFNPNSNFTLSVENHPNGTYLLLNPSSGITTGAIELPDSFEVIDKQVIIFSCSQQIANFTVNGNGAAVIGEPSAIAATGFFKLQYDKLSGTWYRLG